MNLDRECAYFIATIKLSGNQFYLQFCIRFLFQTSTMNFLVNLLISALAVALSALFIPGIHVDGFFAAVIFALVLSILNRFLKPILVILTFPVTVVTIGLFYLVINVIMVYLAAWIVTPGFRVDGFFSALFFSIVLSIVNSVLDGMAGD
jgi:putative membrane protein